MDDLQFPWFNLHDHQDQQSFDFDSENMFVNRTHHQLSPTTNWADQADLVCNDGFQEIKNVISTTALEPLLSGTNSSTNNTSDGISTILSDCKSLWRNNTVAGNNNTSGDSSGDSITDEGVVSHSLQQINQFECSSGKRAICGEGFLDDLPKPKRSRLDTARPTSSNISFQQSGNPTETDTEAIAQMKEMIYREAAFRPVNFAVDTVLNKPKRKNVKISSDPQTVAARERRERISERIRVLQKLVPGGNKMDTASMLDEAANYLKFLRSQVKALEQIGLNTTTPINASGTIPIVPHASMIVPFTQTSFSMQTHFSFAHEHLYPNAPPACMR